MVTTYSVDVYYREISRLFQRGGPGGDWIWRVSVRMLNDSIDEAPARSGTLKASHRIYSSGYNQYRRAYDIVNFAEHAGWVHQGTLDVAPILPEGDFLWVPIAPGAWKRSKRAYVEGQSPNDWLDRACARIAMREGAIRIS